MMHLLLLHISTESSKEGFKDTVFQHFLDEIKCCNPDMQLDLHLVPEFCFYIQYIWLYICYLLE